MAGINHVAVKTSHDTGTAAEWNADHEQKGDHECNQFQHIEHVIENRTTMPAGPVEGQVIYRTDQHSFYVWNGTIWVSMTGPATIVVAADGSGDTTDIQDGIDQLPAVGGVVYIKEGTYDLGADEVSITSDNITLMGAGKATRIEGTSTAVIRINGANNILIAELYVYGDTGFDDRGISVQGSSKIIISRSWFEHCYRPIAVISSSDGVIISDNFILDGGDGIYIADSGDITISSNSVTNCSAYGIFLGTVYGNDNFAVVDGNQVFECDQGIYAHNSLAVISNNFVARNEKNGITLHDTNDSVVSGNLVIDNDFSDTATYDGIHLNNSDHNIISNNRCRDNDNFEIEIENNTCDKNILIGNICLGVDHVGTINDQGTNTHPNGASGTNNLALDDLNIIA